MALNPLLNLCMCLISEMQGSLKFNSVSFLMYNFVAAIKTLYCRLVDIKPSRDAVLIENVDKCLTYLAELAFKNMIKDQSYFELDLTNKDTTSIDIYEPILKLGLLTPYNKLADKCCFTNRAFQEYLSGWHLSLVDEDELSVLVDTLVNDKHMYNVCMYYCGLLRFKNNSDQLNKLFEALADINQEHWRAITTTNPLSKRSSFKTESALSPVSGRLNDFSLSLRCVSEIEGRKDATELLRTSFPARLSMRPREVPDIRVISGLAQILRAESSCITELELRLDHFAKYHEYTFLLLADGIEHSGHVTSLKLHWTDDELLALFLANVFGTNQSIKTVR